MGLLPRAWVIRIGIWGIFFIVIDLTIERIVKPYVGRVRRQVQGGHGFSSWVLGVDGLTVFFGGFRVQRLARCGGVTLCTCDHHKPTGVKV